MQVNAADEPGEVTEVPASALTPAALRGVVEAFVLREGTEYGPREYGLDAKVDAVLGQLRSGTARIVYDARTASVDIQPVDGHAASRRRPAPRS